MAVISAIVAAVSAVTASIAAGAAAVGTAVAAGAITAGTMAAVGSALVSISTVIGVAGLATSVIGLATGNKDLLKAGKIMGYIGLASGIAGGLSGGIGGMMEGGSGFLEGVKGAFTGVTGAADAAPTQADLAQTGTTMFSSEAGTSVTGPMTSIPGVDQASQIYTASPASMSAEGAAGMLYNSPIEPATQAAIASVPLADTSTLAGSANPSVAGSTPLQGPISSPVSAADAATMAPPVGDAGASYQSLVDSAITPPGNYVVAPPTAPTVANYVTAPPLDAGAGGMGMQFNQASNPIPGYTPQPNTASVGQDYTMVGLKQMKDPFQALSPAAPAAPSMWASMPEWAKYSAITSGTQGLTGLASGYYQGLSAEEKLKFEKLVNEQRQQQVDLINTRSSYAPRVSFNRPRGGLVNA